MLEKFKKRLIRSRPQVSAKKDQRKKVIFQPGFFCPGAELMNLLI